MDTQKIGRTREAKLRQIEFHSDTMYEPQHAAINVKVYVSLYNPDVPDTIREGAFESVQRDWWERATEVAHTHGYSSVFAEGRSDGWLVPFYQYQNSKLAKFHSWPGQGRKLDYPQYPDVERDASELRRFLKFQRAIRNMVKGFEADY